MSVQRIMPSGVRGVLMVTPGFALARGGGGSHDWLLQPRSTSPDRGATGQRQGLIHQMGAMIEHRATQLQAGPVALEQTKQMREMRGHIAGMMQQRLMGMRAQSH